MEPSLKARHTSPFLNKETTITNSITSCTLTTLHHSWFTRNYIHTLIHYGFLYPDIYRRWYGHRILVELHGLRGGRKPGDGRDTNPDLLQRVGEVCYITPPNTGYSAVSLHPIADATAESSLLLQSSIRATLPR